MNPGHLNSSGRSHAGGEPPGSPRRRRHAPPTRTITALAALAALMLAACIDEPTRPADAGDDGAGSPGRVLGLVEITLTGLDSGQPTASASTAASMAASPYAVAPSLPDNGAGTGNGTIQLEPLATGSFTAGTRGESGVRYLYASFRVRNAQADGTVYDTPRQNLTFYAVDTEGTIGHTAVSRLRRFDGSEADPSLASSLMPTGAVVRRPSSFDIVADEPDVLQLLTEDEAASILALAPAGVTDVFPYGFVATNPSSTVSRTLAASPAEDQFDGIVTFAFKVPLQASPDDDPFSVSAVFLAVDDAQVSVTQSLEEQGDAAMEAFHARAAALGAGTATFLPGGNSLMSLGVERLLCGARVAGPASSPEATLFPAPSNDPVFLPDPFQPSASRLPRTARPGVAACPTAPEISAATMTVHGAQSGRVKGTYTGTGTSLARAPAARGGQFFPGEEVEVTWTGTVTGGAPRVARYRVAPTGGSASFGYAGTLGNPGAPNKVIAADLNGNGRIDLATLHTDSRQVKILLNNGSGGFTIAQTLVVDSVPRTMAAGDFDGDGYIDLAVGTSHEAGTYIPNSEGTVTILRNNGSGNFTVTGVVPQAVVPTSIVATDVDGDGHLDLAVTVQLAWVRILKNDGNGNFTDVASVHSGNRPRAIAAADLNGNGRIDLAAANQNSRDVAILLNNGTGNFTRVALMEVNAYPVAIVAADLNGNGHIDLATANSNAYDVTILLNDGNGGFTRAADIPVGGSAQDLVAADLNGNGLMDLAVARYPSYVTILLNDGNGGFKNAGSVSAGWSPVTVAAADVDGDGDIDILSGSSAGVVWVNNQ